MNCMQTDSMYMHKLTVEHMLRIRTGETKANKSPVGCSMEKIFTRTHNCWQVKERIMWSSSFFSGGFISGPSLFIVDLLFVWEIFEVKVYVSQPFS